MRALNAGAYVKQGVWHDWSRGTITGLTLSLSQQNAAILVAATALFITTVGNRLWTILRFLIHQVRVTTEARPGYYQQQQALLRNSGSSSGFLMDMINVAIRWRKTLGQSFGSFSTLSLSALVHLVCLTALGLLSSKLVKVGDQVVISSPFCVANALSTAYSDDSNFNQSTTRSILISNQVQDCIKYARACYVTDLPDNATCGKYATPKITYNILHNLSCPFPGNICHKNATASRFDTGLFDIGGLLGMNLKAADRITARKVMTCVPLNDAVFVKTNDIKSQNGINGSSAYYGSQYGNLVQNSTFSSTNIFREMTADQRSFFRAYELASQRIYQLPTGMDVTDAPSLQTFRPIEELTNTPSDLSLTFMTFPGYYNVPVDDLWFSAHQKRSFQTNTTLTSTTSHVYAKDIPISTMACQDQYQICINDRSLCTDLAGILQAGAEIDTWTLTETRYQALSWLVQSFAATGVNNCITRSGGAFPLLANDQFYAQISMTIPSWTVAARS